LETINYKDKNFLINHAIQLIEFYTNNVKDYEHGGFYCAYLDDGSVYDKDIKDLISLTRFIINFSIGVMLTNKKEYKDFARHGLEFLEVVHKDHVYDGYHQVASKSTPIIGNKMTYGQAFCLCAASYALRAGIKEAYLLVTRIYDFLEEKLWDKKFELYVDECSNDFKEVIPYRGQNSNMHMTEAMLVAYEATNEKKYLDKAYKLAYQIIMKLTEQSEGLLWEHYNQNWEIDWEYNKNDPKNLYKPYGFLPGHFTEWSKLLLILERYIKEDWLIKKAEFLFKKAVEIAWDELNGGFNYTFDKNYNILDNERYYWVLSETFAAAAVLALRTKNDYYWEIYNKCWDYSYKYFVDHKYGGWYRILSKNNQPLSDKKSPPGKTDYHIVGACYEVIRSLDYYK